MLDSNLKPWLLEVNSHPSMFPNKTGTYYLGVTILGVIRVTILVIINILSPLPQS